MEDKKNWRDFGMRKATQKSVSVLSISDEITDTLF